MTGRLDGGWRARLIREEDVVIERMTIRPDPDVKVLNSGMAAADKKNRRRSVRRRRGVHMVHEKTRVIKIGEDGAITLSMPGMAGQYLVIEQAEGTLVLKPFDLRWEGRASTIAKVGPRLHHFPLAQDRMPEA
jgi:hypothetical protein